MYSERYSFRKFEYSIICAYLQRAIRKRAKTGPILTAAKMGPTLTAAKTYIENNRKRFSMYSAAKQNEVLSIEWEQMLPSQKKDFMDEHADNKKARKK